MNLLEEARKVPPVYVNNPISVFWANVTRDHNRGYAPAGQINPQPQAIKTKPPDNPDIQGDAFTYD